MVGQSNLMLWKMPWYTRVWLHLWIGLDVVRAVLFTASGGLFYFSKSNDYLLQWYKIKLLYLVKQIFWEIWLNLRERIYQGIKFVNSPFTTSFDGPFIYHLIIWWLILPWTSWHIISLGLMYIYSLCKEYPWYHDQPEHLVYDVTSVSAVKAKQETRTAVAKWRTYELHKLGITGKGVTIAFLDSGINDSHEAFANRIIAVKDLTDTEDFFTKEHGTMVASIACGASFVTNEPNGVTILAGVAPNAKIVMYKITYKGRAHRNMITKGLKQCLKDKEKYGIDIVLLPFGTKNHDIKHGPIMRKLLNKNVVLVMASGNYGSSTDVSYPARLGYSICVGAHDEYGDITPNTCTGPALDFTATGVGYRGASSGHSRAFTTGRGNSCSAASVTGLVALIIQLIKDTAKIEVNANQLKGYQPSVDKLVHDQNIIKKILREIGEYKDDCKHTCCLKSIDKLLDGNHLLEIIYNDVYTDKENWDLNEH